MKSRPKRVRLRTERSRVCPVEGSSRFLVRLADDASGNAYKLRVPCPANRQYYIHSCNRFCFGSKSKLGINIHVVFKCGSPFCEINAPQRAFSRLLFLSSWLMLLQCSTRDAARRCEYHVSWAFEPALSILAEGGIE